MLHKCRPNLIEQYYDRWGWIYPLIWGETIHWGLFNKEHELLSEAAQHWSDRTINLLMPAKGHKILEIGCGPAVTAHRLIERYGTSVDAVDISEFQLNRARTFNSRYVSDGRLGLIKSDIAKATLAGNRYHRAFSEAVFFHLAEKEKSLQNIRMALRPNARFVFDDLTVVNSSRTHEVNKAFSRFGRIELYTQRHYCRVLQQTGFRIVKMVSATESVAKTYLTLLAKLQELHYSTFSFPDNICLTLQRSFREIIKLLREETLTAAVFVVTAA